MLRPLRIGSVQQGIQASHFSIPVRRRAAPGAAIRRLLVPRWMDVPDGSEFTSQRLRDAVRLSLCGHWTVDASAAIEALADGLLA